MNGMLKYLFIGLSTALTISTAAVAQWSIGQPGTREAPNGQNRYVFLVMADPLPGLEESFNDGYQNMHMGDLVQLPGWSGAQRFRLVTDVSPRNIPTAFKRSYLIIWDLQGPDLTKLQSDERAAIAGGKSRRIPGFDYSAGASVSTTYQVLGPRVTRPDGKKPFMPDYADNKTPRPNRYILLDYSDPASGTTEADFETALSRHINEVLAIPGWMAAQPFRLATAPIGTSAPRLKFPKYLVIWEIEGTAAQPADDALTAAFSSRQVEALPTDPATVQASWWVPISPFITKGDFVR